MVKDLRELDSFSTNVVASNTCVIACVREVRSAVEGGWCHGGVSWAVLLLCGTSRGRSIFLPFPGLLEATASLDRWSLLRPQTPVVGQASGCSSLALSLCLLFLHFTELRGACGRPPTGLQSQTD